MTLQIETKEIHGHTVHNASSLAGFEEWIDLVKDQTETTIYRGQRKDYPLLPNICRDGESSVLLENERALITLFKKEAPRCLQVVPSNDWEWLVVAQHHGLHTRLLDWTFDPYVALWFALDRASEKNSRPEVWVMNPLKKDVIEEPESTRPFSGTHTKIFRSRFQIPRLTEQQGCFVLFKHIEQSQHGFVPLERNKHLSKRVARIRIQLHVAEKLLQQLNAMGYSKNKMYPDIDEVAKAVQNRVLNGCRA